MDLGYLLDEGSSYDAANLRASRWVAGEPERSFWAGGLKTKDRAIFQVHSFRCSDCGFLESYAKPEN